jgi:hypothetical protein
MKFAKSILLGTGAVVLAGLILTLLAPKAAHAIVATAVSVVNTTANPASVLDADTATRIPYQSSASVNCGSGITQCNFNTFSGAPIGYRLVVENVSAILSLALGADAPDAFLTTSISATQFWEFTGSVGQYGPGPFNAGFNQMIRAYFDNADGYPNVSVSANFQSGTNSHVILSGYLVNCAVVGCPAIQR